MTTERNNKRIAKNTLLLYFRMFLTMGVSLFTVRVVLKTLGVEDYGVYNAIGGVVLSLSFISGVLANASQRFFAIEVGKKDITNLKSVFSTIFLTYVFVAIIIIIIAETLGFWFVFNKMVIPPDRIIAAHWVYQLSIATFIVSILINPFQAIIISREDMNVYAYVSILESVLKLLLVYLLLFFSFDKLQLYAILMFFAGLITNSAYFIISRRRYHETHFNITWNTQMFKSVFSYSSWTLFGSIAFIFNSQGINILLNVFFGPVANAAYAIGNQVKAAVNSFSSNFFTAIRPPIIKSYAKQDYEYMDKLFYFSTKTIFSLLFVIILPLFLETEYVIKIWLGNVEQYMALFVKLMLVYALILSLSDPITTIAQASGKVKRYHGIVDGFTILTLPLTYVAFKNGGEPKLAFYISIGVFLIAHILRLLVLKSIVDFSIRRYLKLIIIPIIISALVAIIPSYWLMKAIDEGILRFIIVCLFAVLLAALSLLFIVFRKEERQFLIQYLKKRQS